MSGRSKELYSNADTSLLFSMAGVGKIFIKIGTNKLEFPEKPADFLQEQLEINAIDLPQIHKDPFDRLIIAQVLTEKLPVLSSDPVFSTYGVENFF